MTTKQEQINQLKAQLEQLEREMEEEEQKKQPCPNTSKVIEVIASKVDFDIQLSEMDRNEDEEFIYEYGTVTFKFPKATYK